MRILDRYILKNAISGFVFILFVLVGLYLFIDISSTLSDILKAKPPLKIVFTYYLNMLPLIILTVTPYSNLISVLHTLGELNKHSEILSMRSCGMNFLKISFPIIFFSFFLSCSSLFIQEHILIKSQKKVETIKIQFIKKEFDKKQEETNIAFPAKNKIFFARKFTPANNTLHNITIFEDDSQGNILKKLLCKTMVYIKGTWIGNDVIEYNLDINGNIIDKPIRWNRTAIELAETPKQLLAKKKTFSQFSTIKTLRKEIHRLKNIKADNLLSSLTIDFYKKIADPFAALFLIIGALPFALEIKKRKVTLSSLGTGFVIGFIYYSFMSFSIALGKGGLILPILSVGLTPLFFLTVGITGLMLIK